MKHRLRLLCLLFLCALSASAADVLFFCGGRVWGVGRRTGPLKRANCSFKCVSDVALDGLAGVSLKKYAEEPETHDGITPEFDRLQEYKLVIFNDIPRDCMEKLLTPQRISQLKEYLSQGGHVLFDFNAPASVADLLPVKLGEKFGSGRPLVPRPSLPSFAPLPEQWKKMGGYRPAQPKDAAIIHCMLSGKTPAVGIASISYGKGQVWFWNGEWNIDAGNIRAFNHWGFSTPFVLALFKEAGNIDINVEKAIHHADKGEVPETLDTVSCEIPQVTLKLQRGTIQQEKKDEAKNRSTFTLSNGITVCVKMTHGELDVKYPGAKLSSAVNTPIFQTSGAPQELNGSNNEAIVKSYKLRTYKTTWQPESVTKEADRIILRFHDDNGGKFRWEFFPSNLNLDGRKFIGYGDRFVVESLPVQVESIRVGSRVPAGKIRRTSCYTSPRGYLEGQIAKDDVKDSKIWQFFCSGQPFVYAASPDGVYLDFVDYPIPTYAQLTARKDERMNKTLRVQVGHKIATPDKPVETPIVWHMFSAGPEIGNNDFIAAWQFIRLYLRKRCNIKSFPNVTQACYYLHGRSDKDLDRSAATAEALNFKSAWLSLCPLSIPNMGGDRASKVMEIAKSHGLTPHLWTPCGYIHDDKMPIFKEHPDWLILKPNGSFYRYFKTLRVGDFNNENFLNYYLKHVQEAQAAGMERIYMDMGGQASSNISYAEKEASCNIDGLIRLFQELSKLNIPFSVEGMNPLGKDQALFNPAKSHPMIGKEFGWVGGTPLASVDDGISAALTLNYFRLGMYNVSINIDTDGMANDIERIPGEFEALKRIGEWNKLLNQAYEKVPLPFVRETPFGTVWMGEKDAVLFFYHPVKKLNLKLAPGWHVTGSRPLTDIPAYSIRFLEKK